MYSAWSFLHYITHSPLTHTHTHIWNAHTQFKTNTIRSFVTLKDSTACRLYAENSGLLVCGVVSLNVLFSKFWRTIVVQKVKRHPPNNTLSHPKDLYAQQHCCNSLEFGPLRCVNNTLLLACQECLHCGRHMVPHVPPWQHIHATGSS